jgi:hypothetical protein
MLVLIQTLPQAALLKKLLQVLLPAATNPKKSSNFRFMAEVFYA